MKKYHYKCTTNTIWLSFDYGEVQAESKEKARYLAIQEIKEHLRKANNLLEDIGMEISIDFDGIELEELV